MTDICTKLLNADVMIFFFKKKKDERMFHVLTSWCSFQFMTVLKNLG